MEQPPSYNDEECPSPSKAADTCDEKDTMRLANGSSPQNAAEVSTTVNSHNCRSVIPQQQQLYYCVMVPGANCWSQGVPQTNTAAPQQAAFKSPATIASEVLKWENRAA